MLLLPLNQHAPFILFLFVLFFFFFSSRRRHTRSLCDWSSDVCSSDLVAVPLLPLPLSTRRLPPIERPALAPEVTPFESIIAAHYDCMKPGIPVREEIGRASCRERV